MKPTSEPKIKFSDRLIAWSENELGTKFSNLSNHQQSRQMIKFFVAEVVGRLMPGIVPDDEGELESCIVDGSGDGGTDFIYRSDEGQVLIIQAKYRKADIVESAESVGRLCDLPERLFLASQGLQSSLHADLVDLASQIDWAEDNFHIYFITTGRTGKSVEDRVAQGISTIPAFPDLVQDRCDLRYLDCSGLSVELREAISSSDFSSKPVEIPMIQDADGSPWSHFVGDEREVYVGEVGGGVLASLLQNHKASLFTMNIRDYVGDTKTNQKIIETATEKPLDFEYFNNGVTAVAGKITPDRGRHVLICERLSVINGAQTIRSLSSASKKKSSQHYKPVSSVRVMFRVMSFQFPREVEFVRDVTRFNNTQNAIKISDFRSNDEVQKDLARRFGGLNLKGRNYEYKNKRSEKKRNTIAVTLEEFTKAVYAFEFGPDDMFGGTGKLFDSTSSGLYRKLFPTPELPLTDAEFNLLAGTYFACDFVRACSHYAEVLAGSPFFSAQEGRSDADWPSASDNRRGDGENGPQPSGFRRKLVHTASSSLPRRDLSLRPPPCLHPTDEVPSAGAPVVWPEFARETPDLRVV